MADRWSTREFVLEGGLIQNLDLLYQATAKPGSAISLSNFEPGLKGGYRRINGYSKFDLNVVPGTGAVLGAFPFDVGAVALRGANIYTSAGVGWTQLNTDSRLVPVKARVARYAWVKPTIVIVDGTNYPIKYQPGGTGYTVLTKAPLGATCASEFQQTLVFGSGNNLTVSSPSDDTDYDALNGAIVINVGEEILNLKAFRDELIIFCKNSILKLIGTSSANFELHPITRNLGLQAVDSVQEVGGQLLFLGPDGIRPVAISIRPGDVEIESISRSVQDTVTGLADTYAATGSISSCVVRRKSQYRLFANFQSTGQTNAAGILGGLRVNTQEQPVFEWSNLQGIYPYCCDSAYLGQTEYILFGGYDGYVYEMEKGSSFDGQAITATYQTPYITLDDPKLRKTLETIDVYLDLEGLGTQSVTLQPSFDYGTVNVLQPASIVLQNASPANAFYDDGIHTYDDGVAVYASVPEPVVRKDLVGSCFSVSFSFTSNDTKDPYSIKSFVLQYMLGGRR